MHEDSIIGSFFQKNTDTLKRIAISDQPVLLTGETGVSKTLVAQFIHNYSLRRDERFCPVNLTALNKSVFENELFGHTKGAFTGACKTRHGLLRSNNNGTVLFDEFGDIHQYMQIKLLQVIEK